MIINQAAVLLSGGMDSSAALLWALPRYEKVIAILFDYGQKNRDQELTFAGRLCETTNTARLLIVVAGSLPRGKGILHHIEEHDGREDGSSPAIVPGRNALFAVSAAAHASVYFPNGNMALVLGCNAQDARRFPDCHPASLKTLGETLRHCIAREIQVVAPWIDRTKAQILAELSEADRGVVARSWSCYRGDGPCGKCSACVLRADAFVAVGLEDLCAPARMTGGDPARQLGHDRAAG